MISDWRGLIGDISMPLVKAGADGTLGYVTTWCRHTSDYLAAALPLDLQVRRCEEPRRPVPLIRDGDVGQEHVPGAPPNIWALQPWCVAATNAAYRGNPAAIVWHFQLDRG